MPWLLPSLPPRSRTSEPQPGSSPPWRHNAGVNANTCLGWRWEERQSGHLHCYRSSTALLLSQALQTAENCLGKTHHTYAKRNFVLCSLSLQGPTWCHRKLQVEAGSWERVPRQPWLARWGQRDPCKIMLCYCTNRGAAMLLCLEKLGFKSKRYREHC